MFTDLHRKQRQYYFSIFSVRAPGHCTVDTKVMITKTIGVVSRVSVVWTYGPATASSDASANRQTSGLYGLNGCPHNCQQTANFSKNNECMETSTRRLSGIYKYFLAGLPQGGGF